MGAAAVITLVEDRELRLLRVPHLGEEVRRRGMAWYHLPIVDVSAPDKDFERAWESTGEELRALLKRGADVVVHCGGGLGRTGTIAARLLVALGMDPKKANRNRALRTARRDRDARSGEVCSERPIEVRPRPGW
jgi:ADP-ribosyl-[dinitrogen reductase] hydrolase